MTPQAEQLRGGLSRSVKASSAPHARQRSQTYPGIADGVVLNISLQPPNGTLLAWKPQTPSPQFAQYFHKDDHIPSLVALGKSRFGAQTPGFLEVHYDNGVLEYVGATVARSPRQ